MRSSLMGPVVVTAMLLISQTASAAIKSETVEYKAGSVTAKGYIAYDDSISGKRPGVLLVHEWWGLDDYARKRADQLAELGYVAFACDMYGDGKTAAHPKEAGEFSSKVRSNIKEWETRAKAALDLLAKQPNVDSDNLAAIGYCFGGSTALQLAYTGAKLKAVVTFHAALPAPTEQQAAAIKATIVVCHGADDTFISNDQITKFRSPLDAAKVDYEFISYSGTKHSFTVADAGKHGIEGLAYNEKADKRSWQRMIALFKEKFGGK